MDITEDLAYFLGAMRDGCFIKNAKNSTYRIKVYQKNKAWIEMIGGVMNFLFDKMPSIQLDTRDGVWNAMINSRKIFEALIKISDFPGNQKAWKTPKCILRSSNRIKKSYIKGFFDSEGGVPHIDERTIEPKNIRIEFTQANKECLEELKLMIADFGIKTGEVCGPYYKREFPIYRLKIHGYKNVTAFSRIIGSLHPEKQKRLMMISNVQTEA